MILGLTGGYCAGKNTVASLLTARGWHCIDVDRLGHTAVEESRDALVQRFGPAILRPDGSLDRRALGRIVFSDPTALRDHEVIVHPKMLALLEIDLENAQFEAHREGKTPFVCINAAILYRMPQSARCDAVIEVIASQSVRLLRAAQRDGLEAADALRRIASQEYLWRLRPGAGTGSPPDQASDGNARHRRAALLDHHSLSAGGSDTSIQDAMAGGEPKAGAWQHRDSKVFFIDNSGNGQALSTALDTCLGLILRYESLTGDT